MEEIKLAAVNAHESLRHSLFLLEHLRSDFENEVPKKEGKALIETFNELVKTATADIYNCTDFLYQVFSLDDMESPRDLVEEFKAKSEEVSYWTYLG